jgi:hypothetical protein
MKEEKAMLYSIAVILLIAWALGFMGPYSIGAPIHLLLVVSIVLVILGIANGRRSLL